MRRARALWFRVLEPFRRTARERELGDELQTHLQLHIDDNLRSGMPYEEARRIALLKLGGVEAVKERYRDRRGLPLLDTLAQDVRYGFRMLRRNPGVSLVVVASLTLGIGANTAMFSILDSLLLRSLPVRDPQQLAIVAESEDSDSWTYPIWEQIQAHQSLFAGAAAWSATPFTSRQGGPAEAVKGLYVNGEFFDVVGTRPWLGRTLTREDDRRGGGPDGAPAFISYRYWQDRLGGTADAVGKVIVLNRVPFTVVGVAPPDFFGVDVGQTFDVAVPFGAEPLLRGRESNLDHRSSWWITVMIRVKPGQTLPEATAALRSVQPQIRAATVPPDWRPDQLKGYLRTPLILKPAANGASYLRDRYQRPLTVLMAVVALVLLIACANIANLLLARANTRRLEFSLRLALGASRLRLWRQLLVESLMLSACGAGLGLLLAHWSSLALVRALSTAKNQVFLDVSIDWRVLAFTAAAATTTAVLFGISPALRAARMQPNVAMKAQERSIVGDGRLGMGNALVVVQVALSLVLAVVAGLFVGTLGRLSLVPLGFDRDRVLVASVEARGDDVAPEQRAAFFERLRTAAAGVPGVASAASSVVTPVSGNTWGSSLDPAYHPTVSERDRRQIRVNLVGPDFFKTYGTRVLGGRDFTPADSAGAAPVVIVNETFARRIFGGAQPLGRTVRLQGRPGGPVVNWEVVGYVADAVYRDVREPVPPTLYRSLAQQPRLSAAINISVRAASGSPARLAAPLSSALNRVGPEVYISLVPLAEQVSNSLLQERLLASLSAVFGALGLLLAAIGLYGVTAYAVTRRRSEMAIRMALGAAPTDVVRMVLTRVVSLVAVGVLAGAALATWASRLVETLLYGMQPRDPVTFVGATVLLGAVGLLAAWLPARRASKIDPAKVLRES